MLRERLKKFMASSLELSGNASEEDYKGLNKTIDEVFDNPLKFWDKSYSFLLKRITSGEMAFAQLSGIALMGVLSDDETYKTMLECIEEAKQEGK